MTTTTRLRPNGMTDGYNGKVPCPVCRVELSLFTSEGQRQGEAKHFDVELLGPGEGRNVRKDTHDREHFAGQQYELGGIKR